MSIFNSNKASIVVLIVVAVIVFAAIVGGSYLIIREKAKEIEQKQLEQPAVEEELLPEELDEFANWKSYRNEEYGFEVKYPREWPQPTMTGGYLSGGFPQEKSKWTLQIGIIGKGPCEGADCSQYELNGFSYLDYGTALNSLQKDEFISELQETKLNDLKVITYIESGMIEYQTALIFGTTQTLQFVNVWGEEEYFNQILSTFKFLE